MTRLLASVRDLAEAQLALRHGVDWIDLKEPSAGALGAVAVDTVREVAKWLDHRLPLSAAAGDADDAIGMRATAAAFAAAGVDYVKLGFDPAGAGLRHFEALAAATREARIVAVCKAESPLSIATIGRLGAAGVSGIMLDTGDKHGPGLTGLIGRDTLSRFVREVKRLGLLCGLAGRLTFHDADALASVGADYLGFRTALCEGGVREGRLSGAAIDRLARTISTGRPVADPARFAR